MFLDPCRHTGTAHLCNTIGTGNLLALNLVKGIKANGTLGHVERKEAERETKTGEGQ
jgi:hypothetical protein